MSKTTKTSATKGIRDALNLRYEPFAFRSLEAARRFASNATKPHWVVLGDDGVAWVVCPSDAARLERAGYELLGY